MDINMDQHAAPHNHQHGSSAVLRVMEKVTVIISLELSSHLLDQPRKPYWYYHV
jgi:hypothetical protein